MAFCSKHAVLWNPSSSSLLLHTNAIPQFFIKFPLAPKLFSRRPSYCIRKISRNDKLRKTPFTTNSIYQERESEYETETEDDEEEEHHSSTAGSEERAAAIGQAAMVMRRRRRYRKQYPGENKGITEEMRFVAMKLRNDGKIKKKKNPEEINGENIYSKSETWQPSLEGFLKYLVDSELVFSTVERIVDESTDVSYVYFRKTGLERSGCLSRDLEWFRQQGNAIPEPSSPGVTYVQYLQELAEKSPPLFLCHFYNIYFSHIAGGQVIAKQVSEKLLEGREMEFYRWDGDAEDLLRGVRENLNALAEHWIRDEKNKCLRESTKAFRYLGQIVRLIIL